MTKTRTICILLLGMALLQYLSDGKNEVARHLSEVVEVLANKTMREGFRKVMTGVEPKRPDSVLKLFGNISV